MRHPERLYVHVMNTTPGGWVSHQMECAPAVVLFVLGTVIGIGIGLAFLSH